MNKKLWEPDCFGEYHLGDLMYRLEESKRRKPMGNLNINKEPVKVRHSHLKRVDKSSLYKSECPVCNEGVLLVHRDDDMNLSENDICILCGQRVVYTDIDELRNREALWKTE